MNRQDRIKTCLSQKLNPSIIEVYNESANHSVPPNSETHFKVVLVSTVFYNMKPIERHRLIYDLLAEERNGGLHALTMNLYSPEEWEKKEGKVPASPQCRGGFDKASNSTKN